MRLPRVQTYRTEGGLTLVGEDRGPMDATSVIFLHGGGQTRHSWSGAMRTLADRGCHVVSYDARGHGDSDWSPKGDYSFPALASDLRAVLSTVPGRRALVGASMGGITALHALAASDGELAQALVLVDIVLRPATAGVQRIRQFMASHHGGFRDVAEAADAVAAYNTHRPRPPDPSGLMKNLRKRDDGRLYWHWDPRLIDTSFNAKSPVVRAELMKAAKHVMLPTLLVRGRDSDVVDDAGVAEMRGFLLQMEVHDVSGAGHMVAGSRNDAFNEATIGFLERHLSC